MNKNFELSWATHMPGFASGAYGPLAVSIWDTEPTMAQATIAVSLLGKIAKTEPTLFALAVLSSNTPAPDSEVRSLLSGQMTRLSTRIAAVANVVEGQGFRAATMRAVLTGMALVIRPSYPQRTCLGVNEAAGFLAEHSEGRFDPPSIVRAVSALRASSSARG